MNNEIMIHKKYNELTIEKIIKKPDTQKYKSWDTKLWVRCKCSCGKIIEVPWYGVKNNLIKSCGHLQAEQGKLNIEKSKETNPTPTAIYLTYKDKTMNISEWSKELNIPRTTIMYRLSKNLPIEKILEKKEEENRDET